MTNKRLTKPFWFANVWSFFPDFTVEDLEVNFLKWRANQAAFQQMTQTKTLSELLDPEVLTDLPGDLAGIYIALHYGPYRLLPRYLLAAGYRIAVLASPQVIQREQVHTLADVKANNLPADALTYIDASRKTVMKNILSALQEQRVVLVYIDADEGAQRCTAKNQNTLLKINLLHGHLYFRANIALLAFRYGLPLAFLIMEKNSRSGRWQLTCSNNIKTGRKETVQNYLKRFKSKLTVILSAMMERDWTAWENWPMLHLYQPELKRADAEGIEGLIWGMPVCFQQRRFIFDLKGRQFFEIQPNGQK